VLALALALASCAQGTPEDSLGEQPGPGPDASGPVSNPNDYDNDGFEKDVDCNDNDPYVNPSALEACDTIDQDCDGNVDEDAHDATTYYADTDGDGYGDPEVSVKACNPPADHVANSDDCYDGNAEAKPGQTGYFTTDRGDGSYDWNCSGDTESSTPAGACSFNGSDCTFAVGWDGAAPACGTSGDVVDSCLTVCIGICICEAGTSTVQNECR
jgi:hypothetical protein